MSIVLAYILSVIGMFAISSLLSFLLVHSIMAFQQFSYLKQFMFDQEQLREKIREVVDSNSSFAWKISGAFTAVYAIVQFKILFS